MRKQYDQDNMMKTKGRLSCAAVDCISELICHMTIALNELSALKPGSHCVKTHSLVPSASHGQCAHCCVCCCHIHAVRS